jgi:pyruvate formate lyase activating enzyme
MRIGGLQKLTLSDFPGRVAAVVYTAGCNYRCPYCHNPELVRGPPRELLDPGEVLRFLARRHGLLDGVVLTGGEPTLQAGLGDFVTRVRALGFAVKLDTNGSRPGVLESLLEAGLLDYVAMDLKAPPRRYREVTGGDSGPVLLSLGILARAGVEHEVRTTVAPPLVTVEDALEIGALIPPGTRHVLQPFVARESLLDPLFGGSSPRLSMLGEMMRDAGLECVVRGQ